MDISQVITPIKLYFIDLLYMEYIDLDSSFIGKNGYVYFKLDETKLPNPDISVPTEDGLIRRYVTADEILQGELFKSTFTRYGVTRSERRFTPNLSDKYYIRFDTKKGRADSFTIKHNAGRKARLYSRTCEYIEDTLFDMEALKYDTYSAYRKCTDIFEREAVSWTKSQIRKKLFADVKGKYKKDAIKHDTYFQLRELDGQEIYYISYKWWDKVRQGKAVWIDISNGGGTVYVSLND